MRKGLLTWVFWAEIPLGGWKGYVIDEWGSYVCARVTPITAWVVSKNESNCLLENKMVSTLIIIYINLETCQIIVHCSVKHLMAYYLAILPLPM